VFLSHVAFHKLEDYLRGSDVEEQKRNRLRDAEASAGLDPREINDPYAPYASPSARQFDEPLFDGGYAENAQSSQALPLVANASPFQRADLYDDEFDDHKSFKSDDYDGRSRYTSHHDDSVSNYGTESYAPSRNMFHNADKKGLLDKEALAGEIQEGESAELIKETSSRRKWVALCWMLTFYIPGPLLTYLGRMKRPDVRQAWREKFALNLIIWLTLASAVFVIAILGLVICPTQHVYSVSDLSTHSYTNNPNSVLTSIRGEVFDLNQIAATHNRIITVVPEKAILKYGGVSSDNIFPVQVSSLLVDIKLCPDEFLSRSVLFATA
jgi:chitin synthase